MSPLSFISCWGLRSCRLFTNTLLPAAYSPFPTCCQIQPSEAEETRRSSASIVLVLFVFYFLQINRAKALLLPASLMWSSGFVFVFRLLVRWNHCLTPNETFSTLLVTQRFGALIAERGRALIRFFGQMNKLYSLTGSHSLMCTETSSLTWTFLLCFVKQKVFRFTGSTCKTEFKDRLVQQLFESVHL